MGVCFRDRSSDLLDALCILTRGAPLQKYPSQKPQEFFLSFPKERELSEQKAEYQEIDLIGREDHCQPGKEFEDERGLGGNTEQVEDGFSDPDNGHACQGEHGHDNEQFEGGPDVVFFLHPFNEFWFVHRESLLKSRFDKNNSRDQHNDGHECEDVDHLLKTVSARVKFKNSSHCLSFLAPQHKTLNDPSKHEYQRAYPEYLGVHQHWEIRQEADQHDGQSGCLGDFGNVVHIQAVDKFYLTPAIFRMIRVLSRKHRCWIILTLTKWSNATTKSA